MTRSPGCSILRRSTIRRTWRAVVTSLLRTTKWPTRRWRAANICWMRTTIAPAPATWRAVAPTCGAPCRESRCTRNSKRWCASVTPHAKRSPPRPATSRRPSITGARSARWRRATRPTSFSCATIRAQRSKLCARSNGCSSPVARSIPRLCCAGRAAMARSYPALRSTRPRRGRRTAT